MSISSFKGILACLLFPCACWLSAQDCRFILSGKVLDADSGQPLPFVSIAVDTLDIGTISDENGLFSLGGLCPRSYNIVCSHIDCQHSVQSIDMSRGDLQVTFYLHHHDGVLLHDVVVSAEQVRARHLGAVQQVEASDLFQLQGRSLAETMSKLPGINMLKTGSGIVKPVIQGLHSNRILILSNGVRLEGQQWGVEHAPEVDPFNAEAVQVIKGANSMQYGAGAMGGIILLDTRKLPEEPGLKGGLSALGQSNGRGLATSAYLEGKWGDKIPLAARIQGSFKRGGNLRAPDYFLANTASEEKDFSMALGTKGKGPLEADIFYSQFNNRLGIFRASHVGNSSDLANAIARKQPLPAADFSYHIGRPYQQVNHELFRARAQWKWSGRQSLEVSYSRQFNERREYEYHKPGGVYGDDNLTPQQKLEITTHQAGLSWNHAWSTEFSGKTGLSGMRQVNTVDRGKLIPAFDLSNAALYWIEKWHRDPLPLDIEGGLRLDLMQVLMKPLQKENDQRNYQRLSGNLGMNYYLGAQSRLAFNIGSGWRAPAPNELYANDLHNGIGTFEKGNVDLRPEQNLNLNLSWYRQSASGIDLEMTAYYNRFRDFIYAFVEAEPTLTISGAFVTTSFAQADAALGGLDARISKVLDTHWKGSLRSSLLWARNLDAKDWLPLMPANRVSGSLRYRFGNWRGLTEPYIDLEYTQVFRQNLRPQQDPDPLAPPPAYGLLGLQAAVSGKWWRQQPWTLGLSIDNLLNRAYRDYLNRFRYFADDTGRNISLRLSLHF